MLFYRSHVLVCGGTGCTSSGSLYILNRFEALIKEKGLDKEVKVVRTGCFGLCESGPVVIVYPEGSFYSRVKVEDVDEIVNEHLIKGRVVDRLLYRDLQAVDASESLDNIGFYKKQMRIALKNCGVIDPENINEYIAHGWLPGFGESTDEDDAKGSHQPDERIRPARPWRRRLPDRAEVGVRIQVPSR